MVVKTARKVVIFIIGSTIVLIGIIMIVAPGPAVIVIPAGLAVLGTEFLWAKLLLKRMKAKTQGVFEAIGFGGSAPDKNKPAPSPAPTVPDAKTARINGHFRIIPPCRIEHFVIPLPGS